jgi:hypothetical protein
LLCFFLLIFLSHGQNQIITKSKATLSFSTGPPSCILSSTGPREVRHAARLAAWRLAPWPRIFDSAAFGSAIASAARRIAEVGP